MFSRGRSNLKSRTVQQEVVVQSPQVNLDQVMIDGLLSNTIVSLQNDVSTKEAEVATKTAEIASLEQTVTAKTAELAQANQSLTALQAQKDVVDADLVIAQNSVAQLTSDLATANAALIQAQSDLSTANASLAQSQSDLASAQASLTTAQSDLQTANATILDLQDQLANSGGGGGGALEPYLTDLNDASWTFFPGQTSGASAQPEADFLDSYAYDAQNKIHSFTTKSITVGDSAYAINNGAEFIGPKWYKLATYSDGSPVMIGDSFSFTVRMENVTKDANMANYLVALDLFEWPYKEDNFEKFKLNYQRPVGFCAVLSGGSAKGFGTHVGNNKTIANTSSNSQLIDAVGTVVTPGGARNSSRPAWTIYWSSNNKVRSAATNTNYHTASSEVGQLYLGLLVSSNGSGATVGGTASMKISYSIGKLKS